MKRFALVAAAVLLLVVAGGGFWLFKSNQSQAQAAELCKVIKQRIEDKGPILEAGTTGRPVAVLGDSYTAGDGLKDRGASWVHKLAESKKWAVNFDGIGMTGFTNGGYCGGQQFSTRVSSLVKESAPDMLLVEGGLNDTEAKPEVLSAEAYNVLTSAAAVRDVILIGPVDAPARDGEEAADAALASAAKAAGRKYVSALHWKLEFLPDRTHLTESGHAEYARLVAEAIS